MSKLLLLEMKRVYSVLPAWEDSSKKLKLFALSFLERANFCQSDLVLEEEKNLLCLLIFCLLVGVKDLLKERAHELKAYDFGSFFSPHDVKRP